MTNSGRFTRLVAGVACLAVVYAPLAPVVWAAPAPNATTTLANSLRALRDGEAAAPRDRWDPRYVADRLANDPARTFAWVRDDTFEIPYHGTLRGPAGVLMDRQGNSLDRALLLAALFADEHLTVRLAHGTIPADQAARLLPSVVSSTVPLVRVAAGPAAPSASWSAVAAKYQIDQAMLRPSVDAAAAFARQQTALRSRAVDQIRRLADAVGKPADDGSRANVNRAALALADHWWVQTADGAAWRDWDLLGAKDGAALVKADQTVDPAKLPDDLFHRFSIRVVAERWMNGVTTEIVPLEDTRKTSAVLGQPISLSFTPDDVPKPFPPAGLDMAAAMRQLALAQHEWTPILSIGKDHVIENAIAALSRPGSRVALAAAAAPQSPTPRTDNLVALEMGGRVENQPLRPGALGFVPERALDGDAKTMWADVCSRRSRSCSRSSAATPRSWRASRSPHPDPAAPPPYLVDLAAARPAGVEISLSTTSPTAGFVKAISAPLPNDDAEHVVTLPAPTEARFVKLTFSAAGKSTYGKNGVVGRRDRRPRRGARRLHAAAAASSGPAGAALVRHAHAGRREPRVSGPWSGGRFVVRRARGGAGRVPREQVRTGRGRRAVELLAVRGVREPDGALRNAATSAPVQARASSTSPSTSA